MSRTGKQRTWEPWWTCLELFCCELIRVPLGGDYLDGPSGPIQKSLLTCGYWWNLHGLITSPSGCVGGLPG
ncbi:hypothetical protein YC2023_017111 [Brassica napus]